MALKGTLDAFGVVDVLQMLAGSAKTGCLRVDGDGGQATVWLRDGAVTSAASDRASGSPPDEVLCDLLRYERGSFAFEADDGAPGGNGRNGRNTHQAVPELLARAGALLSERRELEALVPSFDHRVGLTERLAAGDHVTIDAGQWPVLVAVGRGCTVGELATTLGLTELSTLRTVHDLVVSGIATVRSPGAARSGRNGAREPRGEDALEPHRADAGDPPEPRRAARADRGGNGGLARRSRSDHDGGSRPFPGDDERPVRRSRGDDDGRDLPLPGDDDGPVRRSGSDGERVARSFPGDGMAGRSRGERGGVARRSRGDDGRDLPLPGDDDGLVRRSGSDGERVARSFPGDGMAGRSRGDDGGSARRRSRRDEDDRDGPLDDDEGRVPRSGARWLAGAEVDPYWPDPPPPGRDPFD